MTSQVDDHHAHDHPLGPPHAALLDRRGLLKAGGFGLGALLLAACQRSQGSQDVAPAAPVTTPNANGPSLTVPTAGRTLPGFEKFAETVRAIASGEYWLIESSGMPAHAMMIGITSWQQQVPLPQPYTGANAWRIPANPVLSKTPISAKTALYRGAIALAVNGVPIFNALNNRGEDAFLAGELDQWGGHSGRADDYHYHIAPLHLQSVTGTAQPIGYGLDGFPLYGLTEPDGSPVTGLDEFNGHADRTGAYHYHATRTYPYINGGMRGVVQVRDDQVDPQPAAAPARPALQPLRGAVITGFKTVSGATYSLAYQVNGQTYGLNYGIDGRVCTFEFVDPDGKKRVETYTRR